VLQDSRDALQYSSGLSSVKIALAIVSVLFLTITIVFSLALFLPDHWRRSRGCPRTIQGMSSDAPGDVLGRSRALGDLPQQSSSACRTQLRGVGSGVRTTDRCWWWSAGMISFLTTLSKSAVTTTVFRAIFHYTDFTETSRVK